MASKVTPSTPGAPSFCLAISYASRNVSILQTWTYSPQKRQDGSAFALTYSLRLSLTLADLGRVCESILHAAPDMGWNFYTVSAWPGHERNLMRPYFASNCR